MDEASGTPRSTREARWTALLVPALGTALASCGVVLGGGLHGPAEPDPGVLVGLVAVALGGAAVLSWALAAVLAVAAVLARRQRRDGVAVLCERCSPVLLRRAAAAILGLHLIGLPAASADDTVSPFWGADDRAPAHPAPTADGSPAATAGSAGAAATGSARVPAPAPRPESPGSAPTGQDGASLRVPRAADAVPAAPPVPSPAERTVDGSVTVLRGDTLWSLAAAHLGPGATDAQIAACWPTWYELNRHVLRDGPHLILPGQRLLVPHRDTTAPSADSTPPQQVPGGPS